MTIPLWSACRPRPRGRTAPRLDTPALVGSAPPLGLRGAVVQYRRMHPAMRNIVDAYVRLGNRKALDDLRASRERLIAGLKMLGGGYDSSKVVAQFADEIALIEAGLAKLNNAA